MFQTYPNAEPSSPKSLAIQEIQVHLLQQGIQRFIWFETTCSHSHGFDIYIYSSTDRIEDDIQENSLIISI